MRIVCSYIAKKLLLDLRYHASWVVQKRSLCVLTIVKKKDFFLKKFSATCTQVSLFSHPFIYLLEFLLDGSGANNKRSPATMFNQEIITGSVMGPDGSVPHGVFHGFNAGIDVLHLETLPASTLRRHIPWRINVTNALNRRHWRGPAQMTTEPTCADDLKSCCHL